MHKLHRATKGREELYVTQDAGALSADVIIHEETGSERAIVHNPHTHERSEVEGGEGGRRMMCRAGCGEATREREKGGHCWAVRNFSRLFAKRASC